MGRVEDANRHLEQLNSLYMSTIETLRWQSTPKTKLLMAIFDASKRMPLGLASKIGVDRPPAYERDRGRGACSTTWANWRYRNTSLISLAHLTPAEFEKMKLHASVGADILSAIDFPYPVVPIVRHHHENWNGNGYPDGIAGTDIPIGARILSVVDCFDALTSDRPYRPRLSDREALDILAARRGTMYDPPGCRHIRTGPY